MIKNLTKFIWSFTRKASKIEIVSIPVSPIDNMDIWSFGFCKVNFIKIDTWKTNRKTSQNQRKWFYFKNSSDRKLKIGEERFEWILFLQKKNYWRNNKSSCGNLRNQSKRTQRKDFEKPKKKLKITLRNWDANRLNTVVWLKEMIVVVALEWAKHLYSQYLERSGFIL